MNNATKNFINACFRNNIDEATKLYFEHIGSRNLIEEYTKIILSSNDEKKNYYYEYSIIFNKKSIIDIHVDEEKIFRNACLSGHDKLVEWLLSLNENINIRAEDDYAFVYACKGGHVDIAKMLLSLDKNINIYARNFCAFSHSRSKCIKWLFSLGNIEINAAYNAFLFACMNGKLELAKYIYSLNNKIDIRSNCDEIFRWTCAEGHLDVIKYLLFLDDEIDLNCLYDEPFQNACSNGHLNVAKYIYNNSYVKIHNNYDYAIREAYHYKHYNVVKWLLSIGNYGEEYNEYRNKLQK